MSNYSQTLSAETWASLSAAERDSLRLEMASIRTMSEQLAIFAALVERLQQQVERLEEQQPLAVQPASGSG